MKKTAPTADQILEDRERDFTLLARRAARGDEITEQEIADACVSTGRDSDAFGRLRSQFETRQAMRERAARAEHHEAALEAISRQIADANRKINEQIANHRRDMFTMDQRRNEVIAELSRCKCAPADLARTCPCPALQAEAALLQRQAVQLRNQIVEAGSHLNAMRARAEFNPDNPSFAGGVRRAQEALDALVAQEAATAAAIDQNHQARIDY